MKDFTLTPGSTLCFLAALGLAACNGDDEGDDDGATADAAPSTPDAASPGPDAGDTPDAAAGTTYTFDLTTAQEVPPCAGAGANATGTATVTVSEDASMIIVSDVTYSGLSGAATAAHIHANVAGMNGGPVFTFTTLTSPISQTFTSADYSAAMGAPADFAAFVTSLEAGAAYINIHTAACPGGEIRGQID